MPPSALPIDIDPAEMKMMGINILPMVSGVFRMMSDKMRRNVLSKQNAPNPSTVPRDKHDICAETPYTTEELVPGKLWSVKYEQEDKVMTGDKKFKQVMKGFGIDPLSESYKQKCLAGAKSLGAEWEKLCRQDLEIAADFYSRETFTEEEMRRTCNMPIHMFVVKMNNDNLLLYCPVRIREEYGFKSWLDGLGRVEYIVVGASSHTNFITGVFKQYPEAKIIGSPCAWDKIKVINGLPRGLERFDVNSLDAEELAVLNTELEELGVTVVSVDGDIGTNSLAVLAHHHLLNCDLLYGSHDGVTAFGMTREEMLQEGLEYVSTRLFKFLMMSKPNSPNGCLASYRFHIMNPRSLGAMNYDLPAADGSTCKVMAESLRKLLKLDFTTTVCVHNGKMDALTFKKDIEANWNWLDGKSLNL